MNIRLSFANSKSIFVAALVAMSLAVGGRCLADDAAVNSTDKSFITNAYEDGLAEIKMAEFALGKTGNADLKAFSAEMITDHAAANGNLKALADTKKVGVPSEPGVVANGKMKLLDMKSGADFDKAYAESMVSDHKKAVEAFEKEVSNGTDSDVKAFASKTLPTLKAHLAHAEDLQNKVGK